MNSPVLEGEWILKEKIVRFEPQLFCRKINEKGYWFIFNRGKVLLFGDGEKYEIPCLIRPEEIGLKRKSELFLGELDGKNLWSCEVVEENEPLNNCCGVSQHIYKGVRELYSLMGEELFSIAGRALQLNNWMRDWNYCSACSGKLGLSETERAKVCPECGRIYYPVISPAIIVAITRGNKILLAHNKKYPDPKRYSILAGFVEAGESLEDTVAREVFEEVGIRIKNIRYFGSQSWPFPHSLMIGFTAEYESGEIEIDDIEIGAADWFSKDSIPEIPPHGSISRILIEDFLKRQ